MLPITNLIRPAQFAGSLVVLEVGGARQVADHPALGLPVPVDEETDDAHGEGDQDEADREDGDLQGTQHDALEPVLKMELERWIFSQDISFSLLLRSVYTSQQLI